MSQRSNPAAATIAIDNQFHGLCEGSHMILKDLFSALTQDYSHKVTQATNITKTEPKKPKVRNDFKIVNFTTNKDNKIVRIKTKKNKSVAKRKSLCEYETTSKIHDVLSARGSSTEFQSKRKINRSNSYQGESPMFMGYDAPVSSQKNIVTRCNSYQGESPMFMSYDAPVSSQKNSVTRSHSFQGASPMFMNCDIPISSRKNTVVRSNSFTASPSVHGFSNKLQKQLSQPINDLSHFADSIFNESISNTCSSTYSDIIDTSDFKPMNSVISESLEGEIIGLSNNLDLQINECENIINNARLFDHINTDGVNWNFSNV